MSTLHCCSYADSVIIRIERGDPETEKDKNDNDTSKNWCGTSFRREKHRMTQADVWIKRLKKLFFILIRNISKIPHNSFENVNKRFYRYIFKN
jgi:hypothetical protein